MLQIAVCDDSPRDLNTFIALLQQYLQRHPETTAQIIAFENGEEMLSKVKEGNVYDIVFLDIIMPAPDGIETGWRLRALGSNSLLIYLTCSKEYAIDSYDVRAYHYLLKPIDTEKLYQVLDAAVAKCLQQKKEYIIVHNAEGAHRIFLGQILYIERCGRSMRYVCENESIQTRALRMSFRDAVRVFVDDPRFHLCGASFLLNLTHITTIHGQEVCMDNGIVVTIPRVAASALKRAWGQFWLEKDRS